MILAFDTSAAHVTACLLAADDTTWLHHADMARGQAEHLFPVLEALLERAGRSWSDLDAVAVGIGPGNFTGIRISVAAARGLALSLKRPAVGISTLEAQAFRQEEPVISLVDARRDHVYAQLFSRESGGVAKLTRHQILNEMLPNSGANWIGAGAQSAADAFGGLALTPKLTWAEAMARIAWQRLQDAQGAPLPLPAPLYLRAADAAPAKETGPVLLDDT